ncbi:hypothetical protein SLH49_03260 [Cognatiyoonia sp. IB215446]|uniref:hypothetical protein n=1 Tax=Cognatiyoonia sp. IB215446 TaxID=3097355 RepID=UPI002A13B5F1|nr:hypothetical protein [Cognatiyoonia sp. IB215446]MDX8346994.1 hypothetical protein [Cognatiyoonia sp. IB215446]
MTLRFPTLAAMLLLSWTTPAQSENHVSAQDVADLANERAIDAFHSLCMRNLDDPDAARTDAEKAGFEFLGQGTAVTDNLTIQINTHPARSFECIVVRERLATNYGGRDDFFRSLSLQHRRGVAQMIISGEPYVFMHTSSGGFASFTVFKE